jgi:WD40 repeat protein
MVYAVSSKDELLGWPAGHPHRPEQVGSESLRAMLPSRALSLSVNSNRIFTGHIAEEGCVRVFDVSDPLGPRLDHTISADSGSVFDLRTSGDIIVAGLGDGLLKVWSSGRFGLITSLAAQEYFVLSVGVDPKYIYGGGTDNCTRAYARSDYSIVAVLEGHEASVFCIESDDDFVYSGSGELWWGGPGSPRPPQFESAVRIWSKDDWTCVAVLEGHQDNVNAVCVDRSAVYSVSDDCTLRVYSRNDWETASSVALGRVRPTSLCQDRDLLYLGCSDGTVKRLVKKDLLA